MNTPLIILYEKSEKSLRIRTLKDINIRVENSSGCLQHERQPCVTLNDTLHDECRVKEWVTPRLPKMDI